MSIGYRILPHTDSEGQGQVKVKVQFVGGWNIELFHTHTNYKCQGYVRVKFSVEEDGGTEF